MKGKHPRLRLPVVCIAMLAIAVIISMSLNFLGKNGASVSQGGSGTLTSGMTPNVSGSAAAASGASSTAAQGNSALPANTTPQKEMRAVWVPFMDLDMKNSADKSEAAFKAKYDALIKGAKKYSMNTMIVQVRPFGDSFCKSEVFPWSNLLTGTQGADPSFDPLAYMVKATHDAGLSFHAWLNPLRIQKSNTPSILSEDNLYNIWRKDTDTSNDAWVSDVGTDKYFNPAYPQVREKIIAGVREIVQKYEVDAIHFDDYFYPTTDASFDKTAYDTYVSGLPKNATPLPLLDWRKANINNLIAGVYSAIKSSKPAVQFGIAPQGNIDNDTNMGADVKAWGSVKGYVDYLCPQLYVNNDNTVLPFDKTAQTWRQLVTLPSVQLYYGLAVYKAGSDVDSGTWKKSDTILTEQVKLGRTTGCDGFMFYSYDYLENPQTTQEVQNVMKVLN